MSFNSLIFLYFFPIVIVVYYLIPNQYRWFFLLMASCYFYATFSKIYLLLILCLVFLNYFSAISIEKAGVQNRKSILVLSILVHIGILCVFKFDNLIPKGMSVFANIPGQYQGIEYYFIFPIGLSYITLQSIGYLIDVYNARQRAEKNIGLLALFFVFFPKIMAGPVERPVNLIPQFRKDNGFDYTRVTNGLKFMAWGFLKKIIIADNLALIVNPVFKEPHEYPGISLLVATMAFTLQIYFDFSGYSDIALGSAQVMGIDLINNFKNPYLSGSISEFWQRWHISLSSWLRDYIFFPLRRHVIKSGKNQILSIIIASMVTMVLSGFWHGTGIKFVVWGGLHGLFITIPPLMNNFRDNTDNAQPAQWEGIMKPARVVLTVFLVSFSWIFFRANTLSDAFFIVLNIFNNVPSDLKLIVENLSNTGHGIGILKPVIIQLSNSRALILPLFIFAAFSVEYLREKRDFLKELSGRSPLLRWVLYIMVVTSLIVFGAHGFSEISQFVYFQF